MWRIIIKSLFLLCVLSYFVKSQEEECTVDGKKGRCVELKRCLYVIQLFMDNKKPQLCKFKGDVPFVCCSDCDLVEDINQISVDPQRGLLYKDGKGKSWDYCLDQLKSQPYPCKRHYFATLQHEWVEDQQCHNVRYTAVGAAGGVDARRGEVPHAVLLGYGSDDNDMQWLCGGTLINDRFILTAGHCISSPTLGPVTTATLGILKRTDPEQLRRKHKIQEIIKHPQYNPPSKYNDIALLKTETNIKFSEYILPACLPNHKTRDFEYAYAVGWGALGAHREVADILQKVTIEPFSSKECTSLFEPTRLLKEGFNTSIQLCWGSKSSIRDTCQGDSGGPLYQSTGCQDEVIGVTSYGRECGVRGQPEPHTQLTLLDFLGDSGGPLYQSTGCQDEVIGVTSYGRECGVRGQPGVYTRVAHYVPWIESVGWA